MIQNQTVDDRTEPKIPKFRCFGNFGSVRFGSVRLEKTEPKQIAEFRFKKYTVGKKIEKKSSSKSFSLSLLWVFFMWNWTKMTFHHKFCQKWVDIFQNQCILKAEFRFGIFGFGSANLTKISVSVVSVFTRFGRPLISL